MCLHREKNSQNIFFYLDINLDQLCVIVVVYLIYTNLALIYTLTKDVLYRNIPVDLF